jgi:uncharacterized damage-inducible protein DinB
MNEDDTKRELVHYLQFLREALVWKLDGLSDYDIRRPMTTTGVNLLGLVKHCAGVEWGYFGEVVGRPLTPDDDLDWNEGDETELSSMYATAAESRELVVGYYQRAWANADATIDELSLESRGVVPWWPEERRNPTMHTLVLHVIQETARHAGHADVIRESIDGATGLREGTSGTPEASPDAWRDHCDKLERIARAATT